MTTAGENCFWEVCITIRESCVGLYIRVLNFYILYDYITRAFGVFNYSTFTHLLFNGMSYFVKTFQCYVCIVVFLARMHALAS